MGNCLGWPIGMLVRSLLSYGREVRSRSLEVIISWAGPWIEQRKDEADHSTRAFFHSAPAKGMDVASPALLSPRCCCDFFTVVEPKYTCPPLSLMLCFNRRGSWDTVLYFTAARRTLIQRKKDIGLARE